MLLPLSVPDAVLAVKVCAPAVVVMEFSVTAVELLDPKLPLQLYVDGVIGVITVESRCKLPSIGRIGKAISI